MIKATAVVLASILAAPSSALAQATAADARQAAIIRVPVSGESSDGRAAGGVTWGAVACSNACEGGGLHTPYWMAFGAGVGAGIGAGIGAVVSRMRR